MKLRAPDSGTAARDEHVRGVSAYYTRTHEAYLDCVGTTFQASLLAGDEGSSRTETSNLALARRAGLAPGMRILDAGCGVCGPSIDIAARIPDLSVAAITICADQARTAQRLIDSNGLSGSVRVALGDFHRMPFRDGSFDAALFLECFGYAYDSGVVLAEAHRVLRAGGTLLVKDYFRTEKRLTPSQAQAAAEWDRAFHYRTPVLTQVTSRLLEIGYTNLEYEDVSSLVDYQAVERAMFHVDSGVRKLTKYGELHRSIAANPRVPYLTAIVRARKRATATSPRTARTN